MGSMALKVTAAFFDSKGMKYEISDDGRAIITGFGLQNLEGVKITIIFDDNDRTVALRAFSILKIPDSKVNNMFAVVNALNQKFRWIKFIIDEEDNTIDAADDAVIQLDSCGDEVMELCLRFASIVDDAYPEIMASMFG